MLVEKYTKETPFLAKVIDRKKLNQPTSTKATYHISLSLEGSNIQYKPGDAIGIVPENPHDLVHEIIKACGVKEDTLVVDPKTGTSRTLFEYLLRKANLRRLTPALFEKVLGHSFPSSKERIAYCQTRDLLDAISDFGIKDPLALPEVLCPLLPRLYSVASSQTVHHNEVHLLVATFSVEANNRVYTGVGSSYIANDAIDTLPIYLHQNDTFVTAPIETPMIMIGPGTGVAPYKGFLEQRQTPSKNWLFFGERNRASDYYYESFFETHPYVKLSLAFSRDQEEKIYVQHKMYEEKEELFAWLQEGAFVYVCGDAKQMAKDVVNTLATICCECGGMSEDAAKAYIKTLRKEKRLLMDVY